MCSWSATISKLKPDLDLSAAIAAKNWSAALALISLSRGTVTSKSTSSAPPLRAGGGPPAACAGAGPPIPPTSATPPSAAASGRPWPPAEIGKERIVPVQARSGKESKVEVLREWEREEKPEGREEEGARAAGAGAQPERAPPYL